MNPAWNLVRILIASVTLVAAAEVSQRYPRLGALLLSLPLVSLLAFVMSWTQHGDMPAISRLARETLVLVPLGLVFFVPLAFAERMRLSFWPAIVFGIALAATAIGAWLYLAPKT